jgi:rod shape-determining protein MreD
MVYLLNFLLLAILTFLTVSVFPYFRIFSVVPMLPVMFLVLAAYFRKGFEPILLAAFAGLVLDFASGSPFGFYLAALLLGAGIVRFVYEEGLKYFPIGFYLLYTALTLIILYAAQVAYVWIDRGVIIWNDLYSLLWAVLLNLIFAIIVYVPGERYFDYASQLETKLKRR